MKKFVSLVLFMALLMASMACFVSGLGEGATEIPLNDVKYSRLLNSVTSGELVDINVVNEEIALTKISFVSNITGSNVEISITKLQSKPSVGAPDNIVYQYLFIDKTNIESEDIIDLKAEFKLEKKWLASNSAGYEDVRFLRYDGAWKETAPLMTEEGELEYHFSVALETVSYFAIALKGKETEAPQINETAQINETQVNETANATLVSEEEIQEEGLSMVKIVSRVAFVVIILAVIVFVVFKIKKKGLGKKKGSGKKEDSEKKEIPGKEEPGEVKENEEKPEAEKPKESDNHRRVTFEEGK